MTHAERKQQRITQQARKSVYVVRCSNVVPNEELGRFIDCGEAVKFAWEQRGPLVGNTSAAQVLWAHHPKVEVTNYPHIEVVQTDAETGEVFRSIKRKIF